MNTERERMTYNKQVEKLKKKIRKLDYHDRYMLMDWLVDWYEWEKSREEE